jgi:hypothetical protein
MRRKAWLVHALVSGALLLTAAFGAGWKWDLSPLS